MATLSLSSAGDISLVNDWGKLQSYLYQLRRSLEYMFNNLTPDENYSDEARLIYVADKEKQSAIEVSLDHISLSMVDKDSVISAINLSEEGVKIQGDKIQMEGVVTVNSYFKIGLDGSMEATNGTFSGDIHASNIYGSSLTASTIDIRRGENIGLYCNGTVFEFGDFEVNDWYGRQILESTDELTGMGGASSTSGALLLWAGWDSSMEKGTFVVNNEGRVEINGVMYYNDQTLRGYIESIIEEYIEPEEPEP